MTEVIVYRRPLSIEDAIDLLQHSGAVAMGGGTKLNAQTRSEPMVLVDLQSLSLDGIRRVPEGCLVLGATTTLQQIAQDPQVPPVVREAARREEPSTLRTMATLGGAVATADAESELLAALLVHDALVRYVTDSGEREIALSALLADPLYLSGGIITRVRIESTGAAASARTGRTRADRPIVAAVARRSPTPSVLLALSGVAPAPLVVPSAPDELEEALSALRPHADFRGSSDYRRALGAVLARRVLEEVA